MAFPPTDWGDWATSEYDVGAPATSNHFERWFRNVVAFAQGSTGSPHAASGWHPYDSTAVGDGNTGEIWSFAADGAQASITTPDFEDGYEYRLRFDAVPNGLGSLIKIELYEETGTSWTGAMTIHTPASGGAYGFYGWIEMLAVRAVANAHLMTAFAYDSLGGAYENFGATDRLVSARVYHGTVQPILRARLTTTAGTFTAGAVYLDRRRVYC